MASKSKGKSASGSRASGGRSGGKSAGKASTAKSTSAKKSAAGRAGGRASAGSAKSRSGGGSSGGGGGGSRNGSGRSGASRGGSRATAGATSKRRTTAAPAARSRAAKPGSTSEEARRVGGRGDFGVPGDKPAQQLGASRRTKGTISQGRSGVDSREAGVGGQEAGPGSFSGGDVDTDVTGVGTGGGLSQAGPDDPATIGQASTTGSSDEFGSPRGPSSEPPTGRNGGRHLTRLDPASVVDRSGGDEQTSGDGAAARGDIEGEVERAYAMGGRTDDMRSPDNAAAAAAAADDAADDDADDDAAESGSD